MKFFLLIFFPFFVFANIGQILHQKGDVTIIRKGKEILSKRNLEILLSDIILTKVGAVAIVKLSDETIIKVNENTSIKVISLIDDKKPTTIELNEGSSFFHVKKTIKNNTNKLLLKTKTASLGVRGTTFFTAVQHFKNTSDTWMCVQEGEVLAKNNNSKEARTVRTGEGLKISTEAKLQDPRFLPWTKGLNWEFDYNNTDKDLENKLNIREAYEDILNTDYE